MNPYWTDGQVSLYLGDCRKVTEWLAADVLVTDPPYGRGWKQGDSEAKYGRVADSHPGIVGDEDLTLRTAALAAWGSRPSLVFGDLLLPSPAGTRQVLIYQKGLIAGTKGAFAGFRRDAEAIYVVGPWRAGLNGRSSVIASHAKGNRVQFHYQHPHAKPVDVMETLIAACPAGVIADPFAGSGSTLVAARNQGRRAIGVELEERYCEVAARRLSQLAMISAP